MARAALQRLLGALAVMFGISVLVFALFFATPGADPAARIAASSDWSSAISIEKASTPPTFSKAARENSRMPPQAA